MLSNRKGNDTDFADVDGTANCHSRFGSSYAVSQLLLLWCCALVARTVLSVRALLDGSEHECGHIVCDVCDVDNEELVLLVGDGMVETVVSHDIVGRLMLQCSLRCVIYLFSYYFKAASCLLTGPSVDDLICRAGLAQVLDSLLGFDGCEFYIAKWPQLQGKTFAELMFHFHEAVVIGILRYEESGELKDGSEGGDPDEDPSSGVELCTGML